MRTDALKLHVFDVGHGDSLVIEFPGGKQYGVIDCKAKKSTAGDGDSPALAFFRKRCEGKSPEEFPSIEFICLTHPHVDHFDGMGALIDGVLGLGIDIKEIWDFGSSDLVAKTMARFALTNPIAGAAARGELDAQTHARFVPFAGRVIVLERRVKECGETGRAVLSVEFADGGAWRVKPVRWKTFEVVFFEQLAVTDDPDPIAGFGPVLAGVDRRLDASLGFLEKGARVVAEIVGVFAVDTWREPDLTNLHLLPQVSPSVR